MILSSTYVGQWTIWLIEDPVYQSEMFQMILIKSCSFRLLSFLQVITRLKNLQRSIQGRSYLLLLMETFISQKGQYFHLLEAVLCRCCGSVYSTVLCINCHILNKLLKCLYYFLFVRWTCKMSYFILHMWLCGFYEDHTHIITLCVSLTISEEQLIGLAEGVILIVLKDPEGKDGIWGICLYNFVRFADPCIPGTRGFIGRLLVTTVQRPSVFQIICTQLRNAGSVCKLFYKFQCWIYHS